MKLILLGLFALVSARPDLAGRQPDIPCLPGEHCPGQIDPACAPGENCPRKMQTRQSGNACGMYNYIYQFLKKLMIP